MHHQEEREADVQRAILDYLTLRGIFRYRNTSGAFVFPETATHKRRFSKAGVVGAPSIVGVIKRQYVGIECKATKERQSENQKEFQKRLEDAGGLYILAYSIDDVALRLAA